MIDRRHVSTLRQPVRRLARHVPAGLVSSRDMAEVERIADWFPAAITECVCFELELKAGSTSSDFAFICRKNTAGIDILAGTSPITLDERLFSHDAWTHIRRFCRAWNAEPAARRDRISHVWLEIDVHTQPDIPVPIFFLGIPEDHGADVEWLRPALDTLRSPAPGEFLASLARCLRSPALANTNFHIGVMFPRDTTRTRLVFHNVNGRILDALSDLGVGPNDDLTRVATDLMRVTDVIHLDIDVDATVGPRIGLECQFSGDVVKDRPRWVGALHHLVSIGCCTPEKCDALLEWAGGSVERFTHLPLPVTVIRKLNSFKLDWQAGANLQAKAYLLARYF